LPHPDVVGTVGRVFWVVLVVLVLLIALAAAVVVAVALPHLRSGSQVLTPEGERVVRQARARITNTPER
jgi:hypothetical protein